jgi:hypothetical protein
MLTSQMMAALKICTEWPRYLLSCFALISLVRHFDLGPKKFVLRRLGPKKLVLRHLGPKKNLLYPIFAQNTCSLKTCIFF